MIVEVAIAVAFITLRPDSSVISEHQILFRLCKTLYHRGTEKHRGSAKFLVASVFLCALCG
jgi:hypothetical protein